MKCRSCKSCQRERMPNLPKVNSRCLWTVRSLIFNDMAIARLDAPGSKLRNLEFAWRQVGRNPPMMRLSPVQPPRKISCPAFSANRLSLLRESGGL